MASEPLEIGTRLNDRYRIEKILGRGGMGTVYLAEHERLETQVAVKEVSPEYSRLEEREAALNECLAEGRFLCKLKHANLPQVWDAFIESERCYVVMEFVEGVTLEQKQKEAHGGPLDPILTLEWGLQIADVLAYLHSQSPPVIFRDLKPANVMVQPDGSIRLIDFGIARRFQPGAAKDTALLGSVGYSPPEQFGLSQTDPRADIYALGSTLHHLLTGADPAKNPFKFAPAHLLNSAVPEALSRVIEQCLAIEPEKRPASIHDVALQMLAIREEMLSQPQATAPDSAVSGENGAGKAAEGGKAPSGPKIISAKLAEAEAQRKRESGRRTPSGAMERPGSATGPKGRARPAIVILCLLLLVGGTALAFVLAQKSGRQAAVAKRNSPATAQTPPGGQTGTLPNAPPGNNSPGNNVVVPAAPDTGAGQSGPANPAPMDMLQFKPIQPILSASAQGTRLLQIPIKGVVRGHDGQTGIVSALFYTAQGKPLPAPDPKGSYANRDGQLAVGHAITIASDAATFDETLTIPENLFQAEPPYKFRASLFIRDKLIGATPLLDLEPAVEQPSAPSPQGPNAGGSGATAPASRIQPNEGRSDFGTPPR